MHTSMKSSSSIFEQFLSAAARDDLIRAAFLLRRGFEFTCASYAGGSQFSAFLLFLSARNPLKFLCVWFH